MIISRVLETTYLYTTRHPPLQAQQKMLHSITGQEVRHRIIGYQETADTSDAKVNAYSHIRSMVFQTCHLHRGASPIIKQNSKPY